MKKWPLSIKLSILVASFVGFGWVLYAVGSFPQYPEYHVYADQRTYYGIAHFWNVISNLLFGLIGIWGVWFLTKSPSQANRTFTHSSEKIFYYIFFLAIFSLTFSSSYYHWVPSNYSLVWDRYSMVVCFMSFLSAMIAERISLKLAFVLLVPLIIIGLASVYFWYYSEVLGNGDLRFYLFVQIYPMLLIPLLVLFFPAKYTGVVYLWWALVVYLFSKIFEYFDVWFYSFLNDTVSGHTIKHILVAISVLFILLYLQRRKII